MDNRRSILVCCGATSCAVVAGYAISFSSVAMDDLRNNGDSFLQLTTEQATWFGSLLPLMAMFGSLLSGPLMDCFGRRIALLNVVLCFITSWLLLHQSHNLSILLVGRALSGMAAGMTTAIIPVYISEVSPSNLRGTMGGVFSAALAMGLPVGYFVGIWFDWRHVAEIGAIISCVSFLIIYLLPETHYWLIKQQKMPLAIKTIRMLRGSSYDYSEEFEDIQFLQKQHDDGRTACNEIASKSFLKPVGIGVALMVFQQCSGVNVIFFYAHEIFRRANFENEAVASVMASSMQVLSIAFASFLVDNVGRRKLLLCSSIGMALCHIFVGGCMFYIAHESRDNTMDKKFLVEDFNTSLQNSLLEHNFTLSIGDNVTANYAYTITNAITDGETIGGHDLVISWTCLAFVMLYIAMYSIGMGPVPYIILSEMVPFKSRGVACGIGTMSNWLCAFILTKSFAKLVEVFEVYGVFWLFSGICAIAAIFIWRFVLETSGKTLAEIQEILKRSVKNDSSYPNETKFFRTLMRRPLSPKLCTKVTKSTRTSSLEEQTRNFL